MSDGTEDQDRESYTDEQDRNNYTITQRSEVEEALDRLLWQPSDAATTPEHDRDIIRAALDAAQEEIERLTELKNKNYLDWMEEWNKNADLHKENERLNGIVDSLMVGQSELADKLVAAQEEIERLKAKVLDADLERMNTAMAIATEIWGDSQQHLEVQNATLTHRLQAADALAEAAGVVLVDDDAMTLLGIGTAEKYDDLRAALAAYLATKGGDDA